MTPEEKAAEIDAVLKSRRSGADASDRVLAAVDALCAKVDGMSSRLDAVERGAAERRADAEAASLAAQESVARRVAPSLARSVADADAEDGANVDAAGNLVSYVAGRSDAAYRKAMLEAQYRADLVARACGQSAPPPMGGESYGGYRRRLLRPLQSCSADFREVDLDKVRDAAAFAAMERRIYADATQHASVPANLVPGSGIWPVTRRDDTGRTITEYYSNDGSTFIARWKPRAMQVVRFNTDRK